MTKTMTMKTALLAALVLLGAGAAMAAEPAQDHDSGHDAPPILAKLSVDRLEYRAGDGTDSLAWEADGWIGGDTDKLWLSAKGEKPIDAPAETAEFQLLYSRMVSEFWDIQAGVRVDSRPLPITSHAVLGFRGTAPYLLEVNAQTFLSEDGDLSARVEVETDLLLTQRLILEPALEVNLQAQKVASRDVGAGVTGIEAGLRLRYEFSRAFAPYVGVHWERLVGETADIARHHGETVDRLSFVTGVRFWF